MANLHRLMFAALVLLFAWLPPSAYAAFPATRTNPDTCTVAPCYVYRATNPTGATLAEFPALSQAQDYFITYWSTGGYVVTPVTWTESGNDPPTWHARSPTYGWKYNAVQASSAPVGAAAYSCPAHAILSGSSCTCDTGYGQSGSSCVNNTQQAKCSAAKDGVDLFTGFKSLPTFGASFCPSDGAASSCAAKISGGFCVVKAGVKTCTHEVTYTGATCTPPTPSAGEPSPVPTPCKGTYGQVNGVDVCLPLGTDPGVTVETGKKTETTTTPSAGGGSSTTSTDEKATCIGSQCTTETTTTTTGADGVSATKTETKTESKDDYCKSNPRSPQCISSSWGGSCSASFTCDGDAVMCAISREQHVRNCKLFDDLSSDEAQLYGSEKGKTGSQTSALPGSQSIAISSSSFDTSDAIGGGTGCIADKSVTVAGSVISIPFSTVCGHLAMLGNILLAVSFLLAGRIVVRG